MKKEKKKEKKKVLMNTVHEFTWELTFSSVLLSIKVKFLIQRLPRVGSFIGVALVLWVARGGGGEGVVYPLGSHII